jgi:dienelactone hydrolase
MSGIIKVIPTISRADEQINVAVEGVPAFSKITIKAISKDYYCINAPVEIGIHSIWESYAVFEADSNGHIELNKQKPIKGSYQDVNGMGLIISMKPVSITTEERSKKLSKVPYNKNFHIAFNLEVNGVQIDTIEIERFFQSENVVSTEINQDGLVGRFFTNKNCKQRLSIIIVSGSDGRIEKAQNIAQLFAEHGYSALALCYFGLEGTPDELSLIPLEYIENAINWLKTQPGIMENAIAIYGRSKGGELALLAGSIFKDIKCVIANTPSSHVMEGFNHLNRSSGYSSWQYRNKPFPFVRLKASALIEYMLRKIIFHRSELSDIYKKSVQGNKTDISEIPVEKINGPLLLLSSERDEMWPSALFCNNIIERLKKHNFPYTYIHHSYKRCGHFLNTAYQSNPREESIDFNIDTRDAWNITLNFFDKWVNNEKHIT